MFLPFTDGVVIIINSLKIAQGVEKIHDICTQTSLPFYRFSNVTGFWLYGHIKIPLLQHFMQKTNTWIQSFLKESSENRYFLPKCHEDLCAYIHGLN